MQISNKVKTLATTAAMVVFYGAPAFATADASITGAVDNVTALNSSIGTISTSVVTVIAAGLGASLLAWAGAMGFKALRRGTK